MNYMSAQEAADKWGITKRRVQILCSENRIEGAEKMGNMWIIPKDANKPEDRMDCQPFSAHFFLGH